MKLVHGSNAAKLAELPDDHVLGVATQRIFHHWMLISRGNQGGQVLSNLLHIR